jgi:hypothetical protein
VIIDAWMQHPSAEFLRDPMFDSPWTACRASPAWNSTTRQRACSCTAMPSGSSAWLVHRDSGAAQEQPPGWISTRRSGLRDWADDRADLAWMGAAGKGR